MRVLADTDAVVEVRTVDDDGDLADADANVDVELFDGGGASVTTDTLATSTSTGVYTFSFPAQSDLDRYRLHASYAVGGNQHEQDQYIDVVGNRLVPVWQLRQDSELTTAKVSAAVLKRALDEAEDWFEDELNYPPYPKGVRVGFRLRGQSRGDAGFTPERVDPSASGVTRLVIPAVLEPTSTVYSLTVDGDAFTQNELDQIEARDGALERVSSSGSNEAWDAGWYEAHLVHGLVETPADLRRAAAIFVRYLARTVNYPERASQVATEGALIEFAMPGRGRPTGIPEVDGVVNRYAALLPLGTGV